MNEPEATNTVTLEPEGYVYVKLVGDQTHKTIEDSAKECVELAGQIHALNKPLLGLIDFSEEGSFSTGANKATLDAMSSISYERIAMFGTNPVLAEVSRLIIQALGKANKTMVFKTREEAMAWLMMRDPVHGYEGLSS
jgi:hypothetical protein